MSHEDKSKDICSLSAQDTKISSLLKVLNMHNYLGHDYSDKFLS